MRSSDTLPHTSFREFVPGKPPLFPPPFFPHIFSFENFLPTSRNPARSCEHPTSFPWIWYDYYSKTCCTQSWKPVADTFEIWCSSSIDPLRNFVEGIRRSLGSPPGDTWGPPKTRCADPCNTLPGSPKHAVRTFCEDPRKYAKIP